MCIRDSYSCPSQKNYTHDVSLFCISSHVLRMHFVFLAFPSASPLHLSYNNNMEPEKGCKPLSIQPRPQWPAATRVSVPTTLGGREERPWERGCWAFFLRIKIHHSTTALPWIQGINYVIANIKVLRIIALTCLQELGEWHSEAFSWNHNFLWDQRVGLSYMSCKTEGNALRSNTWKFQ